MMLHPKSEIRGASSFRLVSISPRASRPSPAQKGARLAYAFICRLSLYFIAWAFIPEEDESHDVRERIGSLLGCTDHRSSGVLGVCSNLRNVYAPVELPASIVLLLPLEQQLLRA